MTILPRGIENRNRRCDVQLPPAGDFEMQLAADELDGERGDEGDSEKGESESDDDSDGETI
jgi:hypothetical protein